MEKNGNSFCKRNYRQVSFAIATGMQIALRGGAHFLAAVWSHSNWYVLIRSRNKISLFIQNFFLLTQTYLRRKTVIFQIKLGRLTYMMRFHDRHRNDKQRISLAPAILCWFMRLKEWYLQVHYSGYRILCFKNAQEGKPRWLRLFESKVIK